MNEVAWFDTTGFMPHGHCFLWTPSLLVANVGADLLIGTAYFAIPFGLLALQRRRPDLPFRSLFLWFSVFIGLCGLTHWVAIWNVWNSEYWLEGLVKAATAVASVPAAVALWRALPQIVSLPSPAELAQANRELQTSNRELEAFVATAAHDLRSPLQGLRFALESVLRSGATRLAPTDAGTLQTVRREIERMSAAVEARLRLSRLAREPLRLAPVDVSAMARRLVARRQADAGGAAVEVVVEPGMRLEADEAMLEMLLDNLIDNAWKFSARVERPHIRIALAEQADGSRELTVRDNGVGFDMARASRLFQPLERLHDFTAFPGHGLGLATVARIAERHGGQARAHGIVNAGTVVTVSFPAAGRAPEPLRAAASVPA